MKKIYDYVLLISVLSIITFSSCKQENRKTNQISVEKKREIARAQNSVNKITISGKTDDPMAFEYLNFLHSSFIFKSSIKENFVQNFGDSLTASLRPVEEPQLLEIMAFGDSTNYDTRVFITPGDSIFMKIKNGKIQFTGKNEAHYNFYRKLDSMQFQWPIYKGDIENYKKQTQSIYRKRKEFFDQYTTINKNEISDDFILKVSAEIKFEYLYNLIKPKYIEEGAKEVNLSTIHRADLAAIISMEWESDAQKFIDLGEYFDYISIEEFKRPDLINNDYFKRSLIFYIRFYFSNQGYMTYSRKNFLAEKEFIQKNLEGNLETFAIAKLINDYSNKGFGVGKKNIEELKALIGEYKNQFADFSKPDLQKINQISEDLKYQDLPEKVMNEKLIDIKGDTIQFKGILKATNSKIKVMDFWASWCPPCIGEIKKAQTFRENLKKEDNVAWIYLSVNRNKDDWIKSSLKLKDYFKSNHQYLILNPSSSRLLKFMEVNNEGRFTVPRYTILDPDNIVILNNAPNPSDSLVFKKVIDKINSKR